ncbi:MAG: NUDIX domain-containing protein [Actinomycetota bacterium]
MEQAEPTAGPRPEVAVGAVVIHDGRLLLIRRGRGPAVGQWSVPGGRVEPGEHLAAAVEREVREETAIEVTCGRLVGWVERLGHDHHFVILDFLAELIGSPEGTAGDDASEMAWVPLERLPEVDLVDGLLDFLEANEVLRAH